MCESYTYKGLIIYKNKCSSRFNTPYFSVVNPRKRRNGKLLHCHCMSEASAKKVADCYSKLKYNGFPGKYSLSIRNKALMLMNEKAKIITRG